MANSSADLVSSDCRIKRSSGMSSLLGKIGAKKQKMSTLEKSKLDWESFKEEEGIGEELAIHNRGKEGYIERKAFLDRGRPLALGSITEPLKEVPDDLPSLGT
ncbi:hypothetical protein A6R68_20417 [Neotoma lepida]|uniref:Craniofacial development protein 1 n=1 Tax=Neotoma lepida TaxID=56216 RepID=A0A1A6HT48_NEOLE|nr:hypothetical protein A6R68_20417 [Neotoma lepida]